MVEYCDIVLWGTTIGHAKFNPNKNTVAFSYDKDFLSSNIELSPVMMPLAPGVYEFPNLSRTSFNGVPGLLADSLPDRYGNAVIDEWLSSQGKTANDFNAIHRLCYTANRGMGALEFEPSIGAKYNLKSIDITAIQKLAEEVLNNKKKLSIPVDHIHYRQLLQMGTSAGGARAKAIIAINKKTDKVVSGQINHGKDFEYWLLKFDGVGSSGDHDYHDNPQYTLIEYAYYLMAIEAGINMNPCKILQKDNHHHFITKRFDRTDDGGKIHMQTLAALTHLDYNVPGLCSYEQANAIGRQIGMPFSDTLELFRRMAFNVFASNNDDHVKNVSFLMDRGGNWRLSPAYDVTFAYNPASMWVSKHQMSINGKLANISEDDLLAAGKSMQIPLRTSKKILREVGLAIKNWPDIAQSAGVSENNTKLISRIILS